MPRYIDAEQFRGKSKVAEVNGKLNSVILYADIFSAPTADVVEIVRCKDCKYLDTNGFCFKNVPSIGYMKPRADHYCSYGERKEIDMLIEKYIKLLREEYERAKNPDFVRYPIAYALYQVWKKADERRE